MSFSRYYTWVALSLGALVFDRVVLHESHAAEAFYRAMTVLVVASPCALVLSIPSAILVAIAVGARDGILFRGGVAVGDLAGVTQFAFDKTGTLTKGALVVSRIVSFEVADRSMILLQIAASVAQFSTHPLARAIAAEGEDSLAAAGNDGFQNIPGLGMEAVIDRRKNPDRQPHSYERARIAFPTVGGKRVKPKSGCAQIQIRGVIYLRDQVRPKRGR